MNLLTVKMQAIMQVLLIGCLVLIFKKSFFGSQRTIFATVKRKFKNLLEKNKTKNISLPWSYKPRLKNI